MKLGVPELERHLSDGIRAHFHFLHAVATKVIEPQQGRIYVIGKSFGGLAIKGGRGGKAAKGVLRYWGDCCRSTHSR